MKAASWFGVISFACLVLEGCAPLPQHTLDEKLRLSDGREAFTVVPQGALRADINPHNAAQYFGAPIVFIIDAAITESRTNTANQQVVSLQGVAAAYDFDRRAREATDAMVKRVPFLDIRKASFSKDASDMARAGMIDSAATPQVLIAQYEYAMGPDFSSVKTTLTVSIYPKVSATGTSPNERVSPSKAHYYQHFTAYEYMPGDLQDIEKNLPYWTADSGSHLRAALDKGLANVEDLFVRSVSLKPEEAVFNKNRVIRVYETDGHLVESNEDSYLLYNIDLSNWHLIDGKPVPKE